MRVWLATIICTLLVFNSCQGASVLFDDAHDTDDDELAGPLSSFATILQGHGISITELDGSPGAITPAILSGYDALFIIDAEQSYTPGEMSAIGSFVAGGHGLLIAGNAPPNFNQAGNNALLSQFDIAFNEALPAGSQDTVYFSAHPAVQGLSHIVGDGVGRVSVSGASQLIGFNNLAQGTIAVREPSGGSGRVIAAGDGAPFLNDFINQADDSAWVLQAVSTVVPEPSFHWLGCVVLIAITVSRRWQTVDAA
jgi:hypothetical protein